LSIGYRGYDPHRTQYFQVVEDGIPIHADMFRASSQNNATESQYQLECWSASRGRLRGASRTVKRATTLLRYAWTHRHKSVVDALLCAARQQLSTTIVGSLFEHGYLVQLDDHARTSAQRGIFKPARQTGRPVPRKC